jgi:hypothetical protein
MMMINPVVKLLRVRWKLAALIGLALVLISLVVLTTALLPSVETARLQATLAPTLFVPPGSVP